MITLEKIGKLYEFEFKNEIEIRTKELNEIGFNSKDINELIKERHIKRVKRGYYKYNFNKLYKKGKLYAKEKKYDLAIKCYLKCHLMNPDNKMVLKSLFFSFLSSNDIDRATHFYCLLLYNSDEITNYDYLIIYLLNYITSLPKDIKCIIDNVTKEDIISMFKRTELEEITNKILKKNFYSSIKQIDLIEDNYIRMVLKNLTYKANNKLSSDKNMVKEFIKDKKYTEALNYLNSKNLDYEEEYILKLVNVLINLKQNKEIPKVKDLNARDLYDAIDKNLFDIAFKYCESYENNTIRLILKEIIETVNLIVSSNSIRILSKKDKVKNNLRLMINKLENNELDKDFFTNLDEYLHFFKKKKFEFVILDLIKIDVMNKDLDYTKTICLLRDMMYSYAPINIKYYIREFYESLDYNIDIAEIYLEIIEKLKEVEQSKIKISSLRKLFIKKKEKLNIKDENKEAFDIKELLELAEYVKNDDDLEKISKKHLLSKYEENIINLIVARNCYIKLNYTKANLLIKCVEESKYVNSILLNIIKNLRLKREKYIFDGEVVDTVLILNKTHEQK